MSLHRNLITSNVSVNRGRSLENLSITIFNQPCSTLLHICAVASPPPFPGKDPEDSLTSQQVLAQLYSPMSLISETQPPSARLHLLALRHPGQLL